MQDASYILKTITNHCYLRSGTTIYVATTPTSGCVAMKMRWRQYGSNTRESLVA